MPATLDTKQMLLISKTTNTVNISARLTGLHSCGFHWLSTGAAVVLCEISVCPTTADTSEGAKGSRSSAVQLMFLRQHLWSALLTCVMKLFSSPGLENWTNNGFLLFSQKHPFDFTKITFWVTKEQKPWKQQSHCLPLRWRTFAWYS